MRCLSLLVLLAATAPSCGSSQEANPDEVDYHDASAAVDAGHAAWTAGAYADAATAYGAACEMLGEPSPVMRDLVFRECLALVGADRDGDAIERLIDYADQASHTLDAATLQSFVDSCLQEGVTTSAPLAQVAIQVAQDGLSAEQRALFDFDHAEEVLAALQSDDRTKLEQLGYAGDSPRPRRAPKVPAEPAVESDPEDPGL